MRVSVTLIGGGRIGMALATQSALAHWPCTLLTRDGAWGALQVPAGSPIVLCVRNDDLAEVLARIPPQRRPDLALVQNGMLRPWLRSHDLDDVSRGLLFFAVAQRGERPQPGGISLLCGPHAQLLANWLNALQIPSQAVDPPTFAQVELEKLLWNTTMGALCQRHGCTVAEAVTVHHPQLVALVDELAPLAAAELGVSWQRDELGNWVARLKAYSLSIADYRAAVKEPAWRNGWFVHQAVALGRATPVHTALLAAIGS